jgi:hypothetical protein
MTHDPRFEPLLRNNLLTLARQYGDATGYALGTVGSLLVGDAKLFLRLEDETAGFTVASYDRAVGRFSAVWPDKIPWPDGIPRPEPITKLDTTRRGRASRGGASSEERASV